jgi:hypothetical protein
VSKRLERIAEDWRCELHKFCFAAVTDDGKAVEYVHWATCPLADEDPPAELHHHVGPAAAIDLRAGRAIELVNPEDCRPEGLQ